MGTEPCGAVARRLYEIVHRAEEALGVSLPDNLVLDCLPDVAHVFLHELCHAAVAGVVPWAGVPEQGLDPMVDEAIEAAVVILERSLSAELGLAVHTPEEVARGLAGYPVRLTPGGITELQDAWEERYRPSRDIAGLAERILRALREQAHTTPRTGGLAAGIGEK